MIDLLSASVVLTVFLLLGEFYIVEIIYIHIDTSHVCTQIWPVCKDVFTSKIICLPEASNILIFSLSLFNVLVDDNRNE